MGCKLCKEQNEYEIEQINYEQGYRNKAIALEDEQLPDTNNLDNAVVNSQNNDNITIEEDHHSLSQHRSKQDENSKVESDKSVYKKENSANDSKVRAFENDRTSFEFSNNALDKDLEVADREIKIVGDLKIDKHDTVSSKVELQEDEEVSLKDVKLNQENSSLSVKDDDNKVGYDNKGMSLEDEESICSNFSDISLCEEKQGSFPDPEAIEVLHCTPPDSSRKRYLKIEDSFWEGKRKLIPDYSVMLKIDEQALQTPKNLKEDPESLVEHLLKGVNTDLEKIRVLIRWIGDNIAYDVEGLNSGNVVDSSFEGVLRSGKAVCEGYAHVVLMFCQIGNIKCRKISGQTKSGAFDKEIRNKPRSDHAWNQVKIGDKWYIVDSTWCTGSGDGGTFTKEWDEAWFLADPEAYIYTHLPMDKAGKINTEHQDIAQPFTSSQEWDELVYRSPLGCVFGLEPLTHQQKIIKITDSKLELKYKCQNKLLSHYVIVNNESGSTQVGHEWKIAYEVNGIVTASIRFPDEDIYNVHLFASVMYEGNVKSIIRCFQYTVINTGKKINPFPGSLNWGQGENFVNAGFRIMQPVSPLAYAQNGLAKVKVKLPSNGVVPMMFHFVKPDSGEDQERNLDDHVYCEKKGKVATFYIQCPSKGEYRLTLSIKLEQGQTYTSAANVMVISDDITNPLYLIPKTNSPVLGGPEAEFYNLGFTTDRKSSIIYFSGDEAVLQIKKTKGSFMIVKIESTTEPNVDELLQKDETEEKCTVTVNQPKVPGFYFIKLYGGPKKYESMSQIGNFCLAYKIPFLEM